MPRIARAVAAGIPHHITQRGNNRQDVFFIDDDRRAYLELLKTHGERFGLVVYAYCLMTNHVHLIVVPEREDALAKAIGRTHYDYTRYINHLHGRSGHLWQSRFFSCPLDDEHYWTALCYVERNPVRARMVRKAWRYPWSSAAAHVSGEDISGLLDLSEWPRQKDRDDWAAQLTEPQDDRTISAIRLAMRTGRPLGSNRFISKIETVIGRRLRAAPVGRPRNPKQNVNKRRKIGDCP
ncbi:MAG: transposase [Planctomycetes bacterium]|nr:transposase [Planctomycetota bacterium]